MKDWSCEDFTFNLLFHSGRLPFTNLFEDGFVATPTNRVIFNDTHEVSSPFFRIIIGA